MSDEYVELSKIIDLKKFYEIQINNNYDVLKKYIANSDFSLIGEGCFGMAWHKNGKVIRTSEIIDGMILYACILRKYPELKNSQYAPVIHDILITENGSSILMERLKPIFTLDHHFFYVPSIYYVTNNYFYNNIDIEKISIDKFIEEMSSNEFFYNHINNMSNKEIECCWEKSLKLLEYCISLKEKIEEMFDLKKEGNIFDISVENIMVNKDGELCFLDPFCFTSNSSINKILEICKDTPAMMFISEEQKKQPSFKTDIYDFTDELDKNFSPFC